jgi:hypothetical protein
MTTFEFTIWLTVSLMAFLAFLCALVVLAFGNKATKDAVLKLIKLLFG